MGLFDQSEQFDPGLNTFRFADDSGVVASRRRGIQDSLAGPLRLIAPRGAIEGVGNITLVGNIALTGGVNVTGDVVAAGAISGATTGTIAGKLTGQRLSVNLSGTNPLPVLAGGAGTTPNVTAEIGDHTQGSLLAGTTILSNFEVQAQALNIVKQLDLNPQGGGVTIHGIPINTALFAWTTYAPALTQSVTVTKTVTFSRYLKLGRLVIWAFHFTVTGSGTASQSIVTDLPFAAAASQNTPLGVGWIYDASAGTFYNGLTVLSTGSKCTWLIGGTSAAVMANATSGLTAGLANTDQVMGLCIYESTT